MYPDIPLAVSLAMLGLGLWLLTWSANRFVDGSAALSRKFGVSPKFGSWMLRIAV